jgi:hypothetical protein
MPEALLFRLGADRFEGLRRFVDALAAAKASDAFRDDEYWEAFLDDGARSAFWWPTESEQAEWSRRWFAAPVAERWSRADLQKPWTFASLIDAVRNGEYELLGCHLRPDGKGAITFQPWAGPYGGTGWMRAAVEAFGGSVTEDPTDARHESAIRSVPQSARRSERQPGRSLSVLANATAAFPLFVIAAVYGQWLLSWLLLGHRPVPSIDDPKFIDGASWMSFVTSIALVGFLPVGCLALMLNALHAVVKPQPLQRQLMRVAVTVALWFATLVLLRSDPGRVVEWWFD